MSTLSGIDALIRVLFVGMFLGCATPPNPTHFVASSHAESPRVNRQSSNVASNLAPIERAQQCPSSSNSEQRSPQRLSKTQYSNTILDLARWLLPNEAPNFFRELQQRLSKFPEDFRVSPTGDVRGGYRRFDQSVQDTHVAMILAIANTVAKQATATEQRLHQISRGCLNAPHSKPDDCLLEFIREFGLRSLRHPLSESEIQFYQQQIHSEPELSITRKFERIIVALLTAPELYYRFEFGDTTVDLGNGTIPLSSFELASRLSYHFWQTLPDENLFQAAKDRSLLQPNVFRNHVNRLFQDKRTEATLADFSHDWLWLDDVPHLDTLIGTPVYDALLSGFVPNEFLRDEMINEITDLFVYFTRSSGRIEDILASSRSFAKSDQLAELYGVRPWNGEEQPPMFNNPHRIGIFTRAAFVSSGLSKTRPIMKGIFLRKALLCETIPTPPASSNSIAPEIANNLSSREFVEALTEQPGSGCDFCHADTINPLGFITENFDPIGRFRTHERLFDQKGNLLGRKPINATTRPFLEGRPPTTMNGPRDLIMALIQSGKPQACFVQNYYRFTYGRYRSNDTRRCELDALIDMTTQGATLEEILKGVVFLPSFKLVY